MNQRPREFGQRDDSATYVVRPSAYAIIRDDNHRIAVVMTPAGAFLPGGGLEFGESLEQTVVREVMEECGLRVSVVEMLGSATQLVYSPTEETYFEKRSTFFRAVVLSATEDATEPDHELVWLGAAEACARMPHESHAWAVKEWAG